MAYKAQAALDFLMTYGWALILIAIAAAAIVGLGILDAGSFMGSRAVGFSQIEPLGWQLSPAGALSVLLKNNAGSDIQITKITAVRAQEEISLEPGQDIAYGGQHTFLVGSFPSAYSSGESYSITLKVDYTDTETGFSYKDSGTLTGRVN